MSFYSKPLICQKELFNLPEEVTFINGAYMSPQLKSVYAAGAHALLAKNDPSKVTTAHFFDTVERVKKGFAQLIDASDHDRIALIPSVSYGVATVAQNLPLVAGQNVIVAAGQFPSNYYSWARKCAECGAELRVVDCPEGTNEQRWSEALLESIDEHTALVALSAIHWADGTLWNLRALRARTRDVAAWLLLDATQSVGALPFSVREIQPDALIVAGYKWMMGPYSSGYAYYGPALDNGQPIEENWINRKGSDDFRGLLNYQSEYREKAGRYSVGEQSNFLLLPMMEAAIQQLIAWEPAKIQDYCGELWSEIESGLEALGILLPKNRAQHLLGIRLPNHLKADRLQGELDKRKIIVSFRGDAIRIAPNVYNRKADMLLLLDALSSIR